MIERHKTNPFLNEMVIKKNSKQVKVSSLGKDNNILVNQETGEVQGTHVVTYKQVDEAEFVKIFTANIALTFELKSAGIKAFNVLLWTLQRKGIERDLVPLDSFALEEFNEQHEKQLSLPTFNRGLRDLDKSKIIAKSYRKGFYFINPTLVFNGNRIAFTTAIELKSPEEQQELQFEDNNNDNM